MEKILTSNKLKFIAFITMIIDHFGYFFSEYLDPNIYIYFRIIGRIAMPIFVFLIVEGYIHTKDIKKYLLRLCLIALLTQVIITLESYFNIIILQKTLNLDGFLNIVFSFCLSIILIIMLDNKYQEKIKSNLLKIVIITIIGLCYVFFPIDYGFIVPAMAVAIYIIRKTVKSNNAYMLLMLLAIIIPCLFEKKFGMFAIMAYP
ncbi:MAG: TraX family protein, partial [Clostridia bacterium]